jgi:lysophospholipase L1-like esterase
MSRLLSSLFTPFSPVPTRDAVVRALARAVVTSVIAGACVMAACSSKSPTTPTPPVQPPTTPQTPTPPSDPPVAPTPPAAPPPTVRYTKYVAFGDSMTEGVISPAPTVLIKLDAAQAYPAILQGLLLRRYTTQTPTVVNRGIAGEQAVDGLPRFIDVLRQDQPQVAIVLEGYNDLNVYGASGITHAVGAVESMVKEARARGVVVLLATLPPERPGGAKTLPTSIYNEFNKQITGTAQDEGAKLVDVSRELSLSAIGVDGIHLTESGYQELAGIFFTHIQSLFEQAPQTTAAAPAHTGTR